MISYGHLGNFMAEQRLEPGLSRSESNIPSPQFGISLPKKRKCRQSAFSFLREAKTKLGEACDVNQENCKGETPLSLPH